MTMFSLNSYMWPISTTRKFLIIFLTLQHLVSSCVCTLKRLLYFARRFLLFASPYLNAKYQNASILKKNSFFQNYLLQAFYFFQKTTLLLDTGLTYMDYRKLNADTKKNHVSLPFIDQMLDRFQTTNTISFLMDILVTT